MSLLTRDQFREQVFARDHQTCINCGAPGQDAHHIIERRLWPCGGYYLDNGATLCGPCHLRAESTELSANELRIKLGVKTILPPHLYHDEQYDKWGNGILSNSMRLCGELFDDASVQKVLAPVLHLFTNRVKYPRTWHLPWSPGVTKDDRMLPDTHVWDDTEVVITVKMDGENTTMYQDDLHARSIDYSRHASRSYVRQLHSRIAHEIPDGWRVCGENLYAKHSLYYTRLPSYFMVYSIWDGLKCLSWAETVEWCLLLGLTPVPVLFQGNYQPGPVIQKRLLDTLNLETFGASENEGYVIRPADEFLLREFPTRVGKYVRPSHVTTHGHWIRSVITVNGLA